MPNYHRSPVTGHYQICRAKNKCPYGGFHTHSLKAIEKYCNMYNDILNSKIEVNEKLAKIDRKDYDIYRTVYYNRVKNGEVEKFKFSDVDVNNFKEDNSGASINTKDGVYVKNGFSVSPYPEYSVGLDIDGMDNATFKNTLSEYIEEHKEVLSKDNHILGLWKSPFDKKLYLDISVVTSDASECRKVGLEKDQQAYFDFQTMSAITIDENATSGQ